MSDSEAPQIFFNTPSHYLVGVEISNFKSYRNKHLIGPFTEFTAIVGPNGSGKSNLMDAISFALVIKLNKLRVKDIESLSDSLASSSEEESPSSLVYVKLFFKSKQNAQKMLTFQRTVQNDKSAKFFVNDENVSKNVYLDQLFKLGFNSKNNCYLIFQNTIEKLILGDTKSFTKIVEDLSGSCAFKNEYEQLKEAIEQKENELVLLVKDKNNFFKSKKFVELLRNQSEQYDSIRADMDEIAMKQILIDWFYNQSRIEKCKETLDKNSNSVEEIKEHLESLEMEKQVFGEEMAQIKDNKNKLEMEIRETEINMLVKSKIQEYKEECVRIQNRLKNANTNKKKLLFEQKINQSLAQNLTQEVAKLENEIENYKLQKEKKKSISLDQETIQEYKRLKDRFFAETASIDGVEEAKIKLSNLKQQKTTLEIQKNKLQNLLISEEDQKKLSQFEKEIRECQKNLDRLQQKRLELNENLAQVRKEIDGLKQKLDSLENTLKSHYVKSKITEQNTKQKEFLQYLKDNYPNVHGRLRELCKPIHKKYQNAISIVMRKYMNAIVVDSFKTIELIFKNEKTQFTSAEIFLGLDIIKAPTLKEYLRNIRLVPDVHLIYDLLEFDKTWEKAIRFVVGNTLLCETKEDAAELAFEFGDGKTYNVIALDGTYFNGKGFISVNFDGKNHPTAWDQEDYKENLVKKKSLQNSYLELLDKKDAIIQQLGIVDAEVFECKAKLEDLSKLRDALLKKHQEKSLDEIQSEFRIIESQLNEINVQMNECSESLKVYDERLAEIERSIFGSFLSRINMSSLKEFETLFYDQIDDGHLNELENRLKELRLKLQKECGKDFQKDLEKWENVIETESKLLEQATETLANYQKQSDEEMNVLNELKRKLAELSEECVSKNLDFKNIQQNLSKCRKTLETINKSIVKCESDLDQLYKERHECFKRAFNDGIDLPFLFESRQIFQHIFDNIGDLSDEEIYDREDELLLALENYPDIQVTEEKSYFEMKLNLENLLKKKEDEVQKISLGLSSSLSSKQIQLEGNIRRINQDIDDTRDELNELKTRFEVIKQQRSRLFNAFLEKISANLSVFYKDLMQNDASQSYLIPENADEPYLAGLIYNCIVPGKIFQPVSCLSGGEKSLAILAFIFSVHCENVPTFFIMDEIDACLDNENTYKLFKFLKSKCQRVQFILISLKPELFSKTDSLIGVCKEKIIQLSMTSKTLALDLRNYDD